MQALNTTLQHVYAEQNKLLTDYVIWKVKTSQQNS
jgi:hypothetical protein